MRFTYEGKEYEALEPDHWTTLEAIELQKITGMRPGELWLDLLNAGAIGVHATVWITLRHADMDIAWTDLKIPHFNMVNQLNQTPVEEPLDPSKASTPQRSASRARPRSTAASRKK